MILNILSKLIVNSKNGWKPKSFIYISHNNKIQFFPKKTALLSTVTTIHIFLNYLKYPVSVNILGNLAFSYSADDNVN